MPMALISPAQEPRASYPGFPPRGGMTFGEVVSSYNMFGNCAAKRHNYMVHAHETHLPDDRCTIREKVALLPQKDPFKSGSSHGLLTPRWSTARSRTPSPYSMARRPRSLPGTPRAQFAAVANSLRRSDSREGYFKDRMDGGGENLAFDTFAVDYAAADTFAIGADGRRPVPAPLASVGAGAGARAFCDSPSRHDSRLGGISSAAAGARPSSAGGIGAGPVPPRTQSGHQAKGSVCAGGIGGSSYDRIGSRSGPGGSLVHLGYASDTPAKLPAQADARAASFVRLNSFLVRTHVTSLVSALAEDGWLDSWEKERLCSQAREDSRAWAQAFFRSYTRFMETEDVPTFVASLRSQIV